MIFMTTYVDGTIQVKIWGIGDSNLSNLVFPLSLPYLLHAMLADTAGGIGGFISAQWTISVRIDYFVGTLAVFLTLLYSSCVLS